MNQTTTAGSGLDSLPRAHGVSRDAESPGGKGVLIFFERPLSDDELRTLQDVLARRAEPSATEGDERAPSDEEIIDVLWDATGRDWKPMPKPTDNCGYFYEYRQLIAAFRMLMARAALASPAVSQKAAPDDVIAAAWAVVQDAIDSRRAEVHPCDRDNNDLAVRACSLEIQVLHAALKAAPAVSRDAALEAAVQAVGERAGDSDTVSVTSAYDAIRALKTDRHALPTSALAQQGASQAPLDVRAGFEKWMSDRGEAANYAGDGMYESPSANRKAEAFRAGVEYAALAQQGASQAPMDLSSLTHHEPLVAPMLYDHVAEMAERADGEWVRFDDVAALARAPLPAQGTDFIANVVRDVAELPDRDSPADWPDAMLVTAEELKAILERYTTPAQASAPQYKDITDHNGKIVGVQMTNADQMPK